MTVLVAGIYLLGLGVAAIIRPDRTKRFLAGSASSAHVHFAELVVRLVVGTALVQSAPQMTFSAFFLAFRWVLVATTIGLFAVPYGPAKLSHSAECKNAGPCVLFITFESPVDAVASEGEPE